MAKKIQSGKVNRSAAIRDLFKVKPDITASEAIAALAAKGITISDHLYYKVKGTIAGRKTRRRKAHRKAVEMAKAVSGRVDLRLSRRSMDARAVSRPRVPATNLGPPRRKIRSVRKHRVR